MKKLIVITLLLMSVSVMAQQEFSGKPADTASVSLKSFGGAAADTASLNADYSVVFTYVSLPVSTSIVMAVDTITGWAKWEAFYYYSDDGVTYTAIDSVDYNGGEDTSITFSKTGGYDYYKLEVLPVDSTQKLKISGTRTANYYYTQDFKYIALPNVNWFIVQVDSVSGYPNWKTYFYRSNDNTYFYLKDSVTYTGGADTVINFKDIGMWQYYRLKCVPSDSTQKVFIQGKRAVYKYEGDPP